MADEESQVQEDTSWWAFEAFADPELPSMSIDEPLEWPDSLPWEEYSAGASSAVDPGLPPAPVDLVFPVDADAPADLPSALDDLGLEWAPGDDPEATMAATPLVGLGGGGPMVAPETPAQVLPESIWSSPGPSHHGADDQVAGLATLAAPLVYADTDGKGRGSWPRRFDIKRGNVAVIALISAVSLVLLGMFLSVRSRNDLPTDATASPPRTDQIATANTRNPAPATTVAASTTVPAPAINIADLLPATEAGATGTGAAGGTATTAPRATAAPTGGTSTATTRPAAQPTATTAPPDPTPDTTAATSPPASDDTTNTTRRSTTPTTTATTPTTRLTCPTFPNITITIPSNFCD